MTQLVDGRYELIDVIGSGGMATVWRARDIKLERMVALKRPHPVPVGDPRHDRLAREAQLSASINHPHLVTVHDAGSDAEGLYLVMELVSAPSLADARGRLRREEIIEVGAQIGRALAAVHRAGVVHRDVKPGNILLARGGAKLTDFGIATNGAGFGTHQPTTPGYFLATANYAAPEVLAGQQATPKSDIFALGVVLYELLAGRLPFNGADRSHRPATINDPVGPIIDRCLSPYPGERPDGEELAALLSSAPVQQVARRAVAAAAAAYDPTATTVMAPVGQSAGSSMVRPPTNTGVDPRAVAGNGSTSPGGRRSPDPSTIALVVLGIGALLVVFILIRGAVNPDSDGTEIAATDTIDDEVDAADGAESDPETSVTVPSGSADPGADGQSGSDSGSASDAGSADGGESSGGDSGGGFGLGGGIIDRLRGVDDMINSVSDQVSELDAKAKDVRDIMERINDAVELAGDAKPEKAAEKLEEAAEKADKNLDGEARDRVFTLIEDVAEQLGVENIDLEQFRNDEG